MPTLETAISFFGIAVLLGLSPGPDNVFVLFHSAMHGRKAGMLVVLGLCTGLLVHTSAVALGLAAVFAASAVAFTVLKVCGALYLVYLAIQAFRAPVGMPHADQRTRSNGLHAYGRGVLMNLSNPKVVVFFLAFLPQFARPEAGSMTLQLFCLGAIFILATLVTFGAIACFADAFGAILRRSPRVQRALNWTAGAVFLGLAARLANAER